MKALKTFVLVLALCGALVLIWYTILNARLVRLTAAANSPFVSLVVDEDEDGHCLFVRNSGAGPAVYGLFDTHADAERGAATIGNSGRTWVTRPAWYG